MKTVIYSRVSTEDQQKGKNIESQTQELKNFAEERDDTLVKVYEDDGWSGGLLERPALDRLRDDAGEGLFEGILIYSEDRLSRHPGHLWTIIEDLRDKGIQIIFKNNPNLEDTPNDDFMLTVKGGMAAYERAQIADRTRRGRRHKAKYKGQIVGHRAPYGYAYVKQEDESGSKNGYYKVIPKEATVVKKIFKWVAEETKSAREVVKELSKLEIPTRHGNKEWSRSTVLRILKNETYTGTTYYNKYKSVKVKKKNGTEGYKKQTKTGRRLRPKEEWIPIPLDEELVLVDKEMYEKAQKAIEKNRTFSPRNVKNKYLLRGLIKCGSCNSPFYGSPSHGKTYYRCGNRHKTFPNPKNCSVGSIRSTKIEKAVWDAISNAVKNPKIIKRQIGRLKKKRTSQKNKAQTDIKETENRLKDLEIQEKKMFELYREEIITKKQLQTELRDIKKERKSFESLIDDIRKEKENVVPKNAEKGIDYYCRVIKRRLDDFSFEERQKFLRLLVNDIIYLGRKIEIKAEIPCYNPLNKSSLKGKDINGSCIKNITSF